MTSQQAQTRREVVIGRNSKVWCAVSRVTGVEIEAFVALGHRDLDKFSFRRNDRVWVFSYSKMRSENALMLQKLAKAGVSDVVYISSSSTIVSQVTRCYLYPLVKYEATQEARSLLDARILTLGIVFGDVAVLPSGTIAATPIKALVSFMRSPAWPADRNQDVVLFDFVNRPFRSTLERTLYRVYDPLQWMLRRWPCILRPFDFVLRVLGYKWYGYTNLSNRLWASTIS